MIISPPLRDVIAAHDLRAEKKFGQNFLLDQNITDKITRSAQDLTDKTVIEIGPGPGGLTRSILRAGAKKIIAIEFDPRAVAALKDLEKAAEGRLEIIQNDALTLDLTTLTEPNAQRVIIANLPYNIATPLLIGWLKQLREDPTAYSSMILMFQKEVGQRLTTPKNEKAYGRLSVIAQWLCEVKRVMTLPPSAFTPAPKVHSSVIRFTPKALRENAPSFKSMETLTAAAFGQRRKMIRSSLKNYAPQIEEAGLDPHRRAETLSIEEFITLASL